MRKKNDLVSIFIVFGIPIQVFFYFYFKAQIYLLFRLLVKLSLKQLLRSIYHPLCKVSKIGAYVM